MHSPADGAVGMIRIVTSFYSKVLESPVLAHHFVGVLMDSLISKQASFMTAIVRGEPSYTDADLRHLHAHLSISDEDYDELLRLLEATLREHNVAIGQAAKIEQTFATYRQAIVKGE